MCGRSGQVIIEYKNMWLQNKQCPTCGQEISEEVINKHLEEI
jgi:hypothetical protein